MHTSQVISGLAAISAVSAAALAKGYQDYSVYHETGTPYIPEYTAVGDYNGLNWGPFTLATPVGFPQGNIGGVIPSSPPKSAAYAGITQEFTGNSSITPAGKTSYFALHGFHFGCTVNDLTTAGGFNTPCSITVRGQLKGKDVATATFAFAPNNPIAADMTHALLPATFKDVNKVSFSLAEVSVSVPFSVLLTIYY